MTDAQVSETDSEEEGSSGWTVRNWIAGIGAVTALVGAITGLVHAIAPAPPGKHEVAPPVPPSAAKVRNLLWIPADCVEGAAAAVGVGSCGETRTVEWLKLAIDELRRGKKYGFGALPRNFTLKVSDSGSHVNYRLNLESADESYSVGVGYNLEKNAKDGGLHISRRNRIVAEAWLREDNSWAATPE